MQRSGKRAQPCMWRTEKRKVGDEIDFPGTKNLYGKDENSD